MTEIAPFDLKNINEAAQQVIKACGAASVWCFDGAMGAGKTTLIKAICQELGVESNVQSPTFSIINEYITTQGQTIYHFDCYRLKNETEAFDIGVEEYLDSRHLCLIEWAEKIESLLPLHCANIQIEAADNQQRSIIVSTR